MDLRACSKCGRIHARGYNCNKRITKQTKERKLRDLYAWEKKSKQIREDALGLCEVCRAQGVYTFDGLEVHHIRKLAEYPDGLLEDDNLIALCSYHHKQADAGEIEADYLRELVKVRQGLVKD